MPTQLNLPSVSPLIELSSLASGQEGDFFAQLSAKQQLTTRENKPYYRVTFRDANREVSFPIWNDSPLAKACELEWQAGQFYKIRAVYQETSFGPQLDIRKIREICDEDQAEGFDPRMLVPSSRYDAGEMFSRLLEIIDEHVEQAGIVATLKDILESHRETLLTLPAASRNHHAFLGGFLEHVLNVTETCVYLADKYSRHFCDLSPPLDRSLVVAGAILHDIGKLRELTLTSSGAEYTAAGHLIGHILQGRDLLREFAARHEVSAEQLLRLEHVIVSHQRLPEWGSPKEPMTPEALIVHHADDLDAKLQMMVDVYSTDAPSGEMTSGRNPLKTRLFRGLEEPSCEA